MRDLPLEAVQELLGHATIEMTMRYAAFSPDARRDAVGVLDLAAPDRCSLPRRVPSAPACLVFRLGDREILLDRRTGRVGIARSDLVRLRCYRLE
jgi:hypothetical protein